MNSQVQCDRYPGDRSITNQLSVAKQRGGTVMVGMEKREGLLLENEENRVDKFEVLGEVVHLSTG